MVAQHANGRPPKEAQSTLAVQQIQRPRGPRGQVIRRGPGGGIPSLEAQNACGRLPQEAPGSQGGEVACDPDGPGLWPPAAGWLSCGWLWLSIGPTHGVKALGHGTRDRTSARKPAVARRGVHDSLQLPTWLPLALPTWPAPLLRKLQDARGAMLWNPVAWSADRGGRRDVRHCRVPCLYR